MSFSALPERPAVVVAWMVRTVDVPHDRVRSIGKRKHPGERLRVRVVPVEDELYPVVRAEPKVAEPAEYPKKSSWIQSRARTRARPIPD